MKKLHANVNFTNCKECIEKNRLQELCSIFEWTEFQEFESSGLSYDDKEQAILVDKDYLMKAIRLANQEYLDIEVNDIVLTNVDIIKRMKSEERDIAIKKMEKK